MIWRIFGLVSGAMGDIIFYLDRSIIGCPLSTLFLRTAGNSLSGEVGML